METLTKDCIECVRGKNSYNGNPRYIFTFSDGSEVKTESDSMFVYGLAPCDHYENKTITFECTVRRNKTIMTDLIEEL